MGEIAEALRRSGGSSRTPPQSGAVGPRHELVPAPSPAGSSNPVGPSSRPVVEQTNEEASSGGRQHLKREGDAFGSARITLTEPYCATTQRFRRLAIRVRDLAEGRRARSIVVTSAQPGDGKTTTACNLAIELARVDRLLRVALVDLDLRRPSISDALGLTVDVSVEAVLRGEQPLDRAIVETDVPGLSILPARSHVTDADTVLAHPNLQSMIRELEQRFNFVIIDTPPLLAMPDAQQILRHASLAILVARAGRTPVDAVRRIYNLLPAEKLLGCFLNSSPSAHRAAEYAYDYVAIPTESDGDASPSEGLTRK